MTVHRRVSEKVKEDILFTKTPITETKENSYTELSLVRTKNEKALSVKGSDLPLDSLGKIKMAPLTFSPETWLFQIKISVSLSPSSLREAVSWSFSCSVWNWDKVIVPAASFPKGLYIVPGAKLSFLDTHLQNKQEAS